MSNQSKSKLGGPACARRTQIVCAARAERAAVAGKAAAVGKAAAAGKAAAVEKAAVDKATWEAGCRRCI